MTNTEIIIQHLEENEIDFDYNGSNLLTFQQWKKKGYSVQKGETAFVKIDLWTFKEVVEKDENGKVIMENGKPKKEKKFFLKSAALFTADQVKKIEKKKTSKKAA